MYIVHVQIVPRLVEVQGEVDEVHAEGGHLDADEEHGPPLGQREGELGGRGLAQRHQAQQGGRPEVEGNASLAAAGHKATHTSALEDDVVHVLKNPETETIMSRYNQDYLPSTHLITISMPVSTYFPTKGKRMPVDARLSSSSGRPRR